MTMETFAFTKKDYEFLVAFLECSDEIQEGVMQMLAIMVDPDADDCEKHMAMVTVADALFPNPYKGQLGMDLAESETDVAAQNPEFASVIDGLNQEEATFAERLRNIMTTRGITQGDLAARLGIGQPAISNMLSRNCRPQRRTILALAKSLDVNASDLWPGFETP